MVQYYLLVSHYLVDLFCLCFGRCYSSSCYCFQMSLSDFLPGHSLSHIFLLLLFIFVSHFLYFLHFYFPLFLTLLFFLSITKWKALVLSSSSNSSFTSCPSILLCSSNFNLPILSLVFDHLYLLQFYFLVPIAELLV